ncbi:hypothetical protein SIM91_05720 [Rhodococcus opacus]|nr:hypothetical protein [Rhodococcus opacus]MDX5962812.1 hypothetical protein [Rhodococcus opacus]
MPNPVLVIDIGACTLTAAIRDASGRVTPLAIDGTTTPPARLVVQAGQPRPARDSDPLTLAQLGPLIERLDVPSLVIDGVSWSIESLTALLLRPVLGAAFDQIGATPKILIVVPSEWAPELQRRFQRIMHAALTRTVTLVPSDNALAYALPSLRTGAGVIAADCGATALSAIAVIGGERGPRIVGRAQSDSGGDIFDRFLLADALTDAGFPEQAVDARWGFAGVPRVRAAREALADADTVTVDLPRPVGRIALAERDVDATGERYFTHQFSDLLTRLDENATEPISRRLMLCGGLAYDPAVPNAARVHGPVKVMANPQHVLCRGALAFDAAAVDSTADPGPRPIAEPDDENAEPLPGMISKRTLMLFGGVGATVVAIAVAGGLALSAAMTGAPDLREPELRNVASSVLPADQSITGVRLRAWANGADTTDGTTRSLSGADVRTLACGGTRPAEGAEADGVRWQSSRIFVSDDTSSSTGSGARATSWDSFDPSATTNVIVTAAIVGRDDREPVWKDISSSNQRCPSTKDDLVRTIVVIPQTGLDPGPPSYAEELPSDTTPRTPTSAPRTTTTRAPQGGVTMGTQRQAWRGLTPASISGSGTDMHVTCVLDIDGVVLKRSCATAEDSGTADHLAQLGATAFNPAPETTR